MKKMLMLLFAAMVGLASCNYIQDLDMDFGDRTYTNEYKGLISAVNDMSKSLSERFDSLNVMLNRNMIDIKIAIDGNTGAINVLNTTTESGLSTLNTTLITQFTAVCTTMNTNSSNLITAINDGSDLLALRIDSASYLLNTTLIDNNSKLIAAVQACNDTLSSKIVLLEGGVAAGFANTNQSQEKLLSSIDSTITHLNNTIVEGNKSRDKALAEIIKAMAIMNRNDSVRNDLLTTIKETMIKDLADNGVYLSGKSIYVVPEIWQLLKQEGDQSVLWQAFDSAFTGVTYPTPIKVKNSQVTPNHVKDTTATFTFAGYSNDAVMKAGTLEARSEANGKTVYRLVRVPSDIYYDVALNRPEYPNLFAVRVKDVRGYYQVFGAVTGTPTQVDGNTVDPADKPKTARITIKNYQNGSICDQFNAYAFSYNADSTAYNADTIARPTLTWNW